MRPKFTPRYRCCTSETAAASPPGRARAERQNSRSAPYGREPIGSLLDVSHDVLRLKDVAGVTHHMTTDAACEARVVQVSPTAPAGTQTVRRSQGLPAYNSAAIPWPSPAALVLARTKSSPRLGLSVAKTRPS